MTEDSKEISIDLSSLKKLNWTYALLIILLILGVYLRSYHLDFPSIGYHNMKENEYISEAIFFNEQGDFLHRRTYNFYGLEQGPGYFEEYAQPPLIPYMTTLFWKVTGEQLWVPRLIIMLFMLGSILTIYFVVKKLTKSEYMALLSSFLLTIMPLGVYFGRNVQPESPALLFILLAANFYLKWAENLDKKQLLYTMLALSFAGMFKLTFLIIGLPFLFIFPYKKVIELFKHHKNEFFSQIKYFITGLLPFIIIQGIFEFTIIDPSKKNVEISIARLSNVFDLNYWNRIWPSLGSYIADNYTWWFFWFAILGLVFAVIKYKSQLSKFLIGYVVAIPIYIGLLSSKIGGHSYYQMPFLPLICILGAFFLYNVGAILKQAIKIKYIEFASLLLILLTLGSVQAANDRVWGTVFYGQDFLGEYLKTTLGPDERFAMYGHSQDQAVCTYARHRCGWVNSLDEFKEIEKTFSLRYIYVGDVGFEKLASQDPLWVYIADNYHIDLVGLMNINNNLVPRHFILKKGGKFNLAEIQGKQAQLAKTYDSKHGDISYYYITNG